MIHLLPSKFQPSSYHQRARTNHYRITLALVFSLLGFTFASRAQSFYAMGHDSDMLLTVGIGSASYFGELNNPNDYLDAKPSFNVGVTFFPMPDLIGNRLALRSEMAYFRLQGSDEEATTRRVIRNLSFFSDNLELQGAINLHLLPVNYQFRRNNVFNLYGVLGLGLLYSNPKTIYQGSAVALQPLRTEGVSYSRWNLVIPMGFGIKMLQNNKVSIDFEGTWRKTFTDYLDDASGRTYADPATLSSDLARALADRRGEYYAKRGESFTGNPGDIRGNPELLDSYFLLTLRVSYHIPVRLPDMNKKLMIILKKKRKAKGSA